MMQDRIKVIDSYPGSGKTNYAIQEINKLSNDQKVIYITPYIDEVKRIIDHCPNKNFVQPEKTYEYPTKGKHLLKLISDQQNIVSTHALFSNINEELIDLLRSNDYILYLDEVFQTVDKYSTVLGKNHSRRGEEFDEMTADDATKMDIATMLNKNIISINDDYSVSWCHEEDTLSKYYQLKNLANRNLLYLIDKNLLLWSFPIEVFREGIFSEINILTYMFDAQLQSYYYKYFDVEYVVYSVHKNDDDTLYITKENNNDNEKIWKENIRGKINLITDEKMNRIGDSYRDASNKLVTTALSKTWYYNHPDSLKILRNNLINYFVNQTRSSANSRLWTCFKSNTDKIKSKNVTMSSWIAINTRATNDYGDRTVVAYLINKYLDPTYVKFFAKKNIQVNEDGFALSELIQWIWRSAIRNDKEITLYLPSQRMRNLLMDFLNE
jgi:hypothetical protein